LTLVEHKRPDIKVVNFTLLPADWYRALINRRYPNLNLPEIDPAQSALERAQLICRRTLDDQPVYLDTWTEGLNPIENQDCTFTRQGLLVRLSPPGTQVNVEELTQTNDFLWQNYRDTGRLTSLRPADSRTRELMYYYSHALGELGIAYQQAGRLDLAQETYLQANQISPDNGLTRSLLASILIEQGHFDQAIELEKEAVTVQPTSISSYLNLGLIYAQVKQQPDQAIHYLRKYLDVLPHKPQYNKQRQEITQLINQL
jgi:tetratricopeptide (TPR) repeat protein